MKLSALPRRLPLAPRFQPVLALVAVLVGFSLLTRIVLWLHGGTQVPVTPATLAQVFFVGLGFDLAAAAYFIVPMVLWLALLPDRIARSRAHRWLFGLLFVATCYVLALVALSEWVFWDEFGTRFNLALFALSSDGLTP